MKIKSTFIILTLAMNFAYANTEKLNAQETQSQEPQTQEPQSQDSSAIKSEEELAEDRIYQLLSGGKDPFSYGSARGGSDASNGSNLVPIDISNITTSIKLKGVFKLSTSEEAFALVQIGDGKDARRQLVKKDDLILINQSGRQSSQSRTSKYLQIVEIKENTITIAPQMRPDEQIVIR